MNFNFRLLQREIKLEKTKRCCLKMSQICLVTLIGYRETRRGTILAFIIQLNSLPTSIYKTLSKTIKTMGRFINRLAYTYGAAA